MPHVQNVHFLIENPETETRDEALMDVKDVWTLFICLKLSILE